jgi:hypothetical protein
LKGAETSISVYALHTENAAFIGIQEAPDDSERVIWEVDPRTYGVVLEVFYEVKGYSGAMIHTYLSRIGLGSPLGCSKHR